MKPDRPENRRRCRENDGRTGAAVLACVLFLVPAASAQVNIEQHRPREQGTSLVVDVAASLRSGNSDLYDVTAGGQLHHRSGVHSILAIARVRYGENDDRQFANSSFGHLRYTRWITGRFAGEAFAQLERDRFTLLQVRSLLGAGGRLRFLDKENVEMFYGSSFMLELERLDASKVLNHPARSEAVRWSNYASVRWTINERSSLSSTVYIQPRLGDFADFRLLHDAMLEVGVTERVSLRVALRQRLDNRPPDNLEDHDIFVENGVRVRL